MTAELSATFGLEREDRVTARRMPAGSGRPLVAPEFAVTRKKAKVSSRGLNATDAITAAQLIAHQPLVPFGRMVMCWPEFRFDRG